MQTYVFLDLDDTILQTLPKCPPDEVVEPAACSRDGVPLSFTTGRQRTLLRLLAGAATVIPTTARNLDAFRRVHLPFHDLAILDFGGVILQRDGVPDPVWDAVVRPRAREVGPELYDLLREVRHFIDRNQLAINARLVCDLDMPLYLVLKHPTGDVEALRVVLAEHWGTVDPGRFFVHFNGNNLSLVPRFLGKERAVRHVLDHHLGAEPILTIGVGDSFSDAPFLSLCDYALLPRGSQLARSALIPEDA